MTQTVQRPSGVRPQGIMSEAELHILGSRMRGGILNKVRRGIWPLRCQQAFFTMPMSMSFWIRPTGATEHPAVYLERFGAPVR